MTSHEFKGRDGTRRDFPVKAWRPLGRGVETDGKALGGGPSETIGPVVCLMCLLAWLRSAGIEDPYPVDPPRRDRPPNTEKACASARLQAVAPTVRLPLFLSHRRPSKRHCVP